MGEMIASKYYGRVIRKHSRFTDAITAHNRSLDIATQLEDTIEMVEALNDLGTDCRRQGDLAKANDHLIRALKLTDAYSDHKSDEALSMRVKTLNGIGMIEIEMCNYPIADSVLHEALQGEIKLGRDVGMAVNYSRLGAVKQAFGQLDSAWFYYRKSLECNQQANNEIGVALCHLHFGELHEDERRFSHAINEYRQAYDQLKDLGERWYWLEACLALARVSIKMGEKEEAREYLQQAEAEALLVGSREHQARGHLTRYELARLEGNPQEALDYYVKGTELLDSHAGHGGSERVDRDDGVRLLAADDGEGLLQPAQLLVLADGGGTGAGGAGTHVDDGSPFSYYLTGTCGDALVGGLPAGGVERVGRGIEDAHHLRGAQVEQLASDVDEVVHALWGVRVG